MVAVRPLPVPPLALLALVVAAGCAAPHAPGPVPDPVSSEPATPQAVRFAIVGDTGTGEAAAYRVAAAIGEVCEARGCSFIVHTGDILYDDGPASVHDPQFDAKFERPYGALGLPVHLVLGNHDVGNPGNAGDLWKWREVGDRNVAYGQREDRLTDTWHMPARWYAFEEGPAAFAAIDTTAFVLGGLEADAGGELREAMQDMEAWIGGAWPAGATWRFAVGHHPHRSNGMHGDAGDYDGPDELAGDLLEEFYARHVCGKADVLLTGHDHDLQLLRPTPDCEGTWFVVSGAGARPREIEDPLRHEAVFQRGDDYGFWWAEATADHLVLVAYDGEGDVLHTFSLPRSG